MIRQTDHTMPACDPSSCAGTVPARDRLRIVLQYSGERSYNALALRLGLKRSENLYRIRKGYNGISMDLALRIRNICPSLSLSWLLGGEGDPEAPDRTSAEAASAEVLYLPLYPDLLSLDRLCRIIRKGESPERVRLVSLKPGKYDEIAVPRTEIDGLYRICGTFRYWAD